MNVATLLTKAARVHAGSVALRYGATEIGYAELDLRTGRLASGLKKLGLSAGDRLLLWLHNRPELVELLLACWKAGLIAVPVNVRLHPREMAYIASDCGAAALAVDEALVDAVESVRHELPPDVHLVRVGGESGPLPGYDALLAQDPLVASEVAEDDVAWLFYTSGTTGRPKGAMLTHRNLIAMTMNCLADICSFQPEDVVLHVAPLTHGSGLYLLPALARGSLNVISPHRTFEPGQVFEMIAAQGVTVIAFLAPTMIVKLIDDPALGAHDLSSLRCVPYGGGPMYVEDLKRAIDRLGPIWVQLYGQGETPMTGLYLRSQEHRYDTPEAERRLGSAGIPRTDVELRIVDAEGRDLGEEVVGEILIRGATVMKGYWANPAATAETIREGWLHTGDLGYVDRDGYVYVVDRARDMIVSGGNNIYAREVEEVLLTHPQIVEAAVIGVPDPYWGESVHAIVVVRPGSAIGEEEVVRHCQTALASYKKPRSVEFVGELPKNAYGKVLKRELRERYWSGYERRVGGGRQVPPSPRGGRPDGREPG
ncbi:MAG TPA: long-chain fatty acid--CoA ligase [Candidatus Dormibacteraeota bacterium]|nr:long-chain fatty acid--CoA ligase [Candidatus Dormibacteraeota bacterium]